MSSLNLIQKKSPRLEPGAGESVKRQQQDNAARAKNSSDEFERLHSLFLDVLRRSFNADRLFKTFLAKCDSREVFAAAKLYFLKSPFLAKRRRERGDARVGPLTTRITDLRTKIRRGDRSKEALCELYLMEDGLAKVKLAHATKRMGVSAVHFHLFFLHEYLRLASGAAPSADDLTDILQAAYLAMGDEVTVISAHSVNMNLRNFVKNNPGECARLTAALIPTISPSARS